MDESGTHFQLGSSLAKRLFPLVVVIACLIGLLFPVTVYILDYRSLTREADFLSKRIAHELEEIVVDTPRLWKYQIYRFAHISQEVLVNKDVSSIRIYDDRNTEVESYRFINPELSGSWWAEPRGAGRIVYNNKTIGTVQVTISPRNLIAKTALTALVSSCLGILLACLAYRAPIKIVRRMDEEIQTLVDDLEGFTNESRQLRQAAQASEKRFMELVQGLDAIIWEGDPVSGRYCFVSHQAERLLGLPAERWRLAEEFFINQVHAVDRDRVREAYRTAIAEETPGEIEYRRYREDGSVVWLRDTFRIVSADGKGRGRLWGVMVDITPRMKAEEALLAANENLSNTVRELRRSNREVSILREMGDLYQLCSSLDEACEVVATISEKLFPAASGTLFMFDGSQNLLKKATAWGNVLNEQHIPTFLPDSCLALQSGKLQASTSAQGVACCCENMSLLCGAAICIPLVAQGSILGVYQLYYGSQSDYAEASHNQLLLAMTEHTALAISNMRLRETLRVQALHDPLTTLFNRRYADEAMLREIAQAERKKYSFGVMMIDIDHFKLFNDTHGHDAGDMLLIKAGSVMNSFFREYDRVCRYGGEEFVCIIPELNFETILHRAEQLRQLIKEIRITSAGRPLGGVTISVGIAMYPQHGTSKAELLRSADRALYRAKNAGRDCVMAEEVCDHKQLTMWH